MNPIEEQLQLTWLDDNTNIPLMDCGHQIPKDIPDFREEIIHHPYCPESTYKHPEPTIVIANPLQTINGKDHSKGKPFYTNLFLSPFPKF